MAVPEHRPPVVCLGEVVVDLFAEPAGASIVEAGSFVPRTGGSQANVAAGAARLGMPAALVGRAGRDVWGGWLRERLAEEAVDVEMLELSHGAETTLAFVTSSADGEPSFAIFGGSDQGCVAGFEPRLEEVLAAHPGGVLAFGSDTLIVEADREALAQLLPAARAAGWSVLYDPNLREGRWPDRGTMLSVASAPLPGVSVLKANSLEAFALTGLDDPRAAAAALAAAGPREVLVTAGAAGAFLADRAGTVAIPGLPARVLDTTGAGDAVAAVLAAGLVCGGTVSVEIASLAMEVAARVCEARGALAGLPPAAEARGMLARALGT